MAYDFSGKTALVTGGSRGIGKEIVKQLTKCNAKVFALSKTQDNLNRLKQEIPSVITVCVDLANWKEVQTLLDGMETVDLLVNNVGNANLIQFGDITEDIFDKHYSVNVKPVINISQIIVEKLKKEKKTGSIVNVSSVSTMKYLGYPVYSTGKSAVDNLTKTMAVELSSFGIRVNSVNPTAVYTDALETALQDPQFNFTLNALLELIPLNSICTVEDIGNAVLFLLSDKARMINGVNLLIDGGQSCI